MFTRRSILKSILALPLVSRFGEPQPPAVKVAPAQPPLPMRAIVTSHPYYGPYTSIEELMREKTKAAHNAMVEAMERTLQNYP